MATLPKVHCFSGSPFVWRALIALEEKGVEHEQNWIPRMTWEEKRSEFLDRNPRGKLPIVEWSEDVTLYESLGICLFLDLERPDPPFFPKSTADRARVSIRAAEAVAYLELSSMGALDMALRRGPNKPVPDEQRAANRAMHEELARWDGYAKDGGFSHIACEQFSLADILLFPPIAFTVRCKLDLDNIAPNLRKWYDRVADRPTVQKSWPPHWRESEGSDIGLNEV